MVWRGAGNLKMTPVEDAERAKAKGYGELYTPQPDDMLPRRHSFEQLIEWAADEKEKGGLRDRLGFAQGLLFDIYKTLEKGGPCSPVFDWIWQEVETYVRSPFTPRGPAVTP